MTLKPRAAILISTLLLTACSAPNGAVPDSGSEACDDIWTINSVTSQTGMQAEAQRYYEAAWLPAREIAKARNVIKDFTLLQSDKPDQPDFQLITIYEDGAQFAASEDAFQAIFKELELPRPLLIDGLTRDSIISETIGADDYRTYSFKTGACPD